ncbi:TIGR02444 family protein [Arsukibacterium indicum]|uniref:TIGR02444 family protein n=1 Tax=Arsukibacterium indicum TaxID=2848612 RepID=A0ABS6MR14_9GAMM|nr:TIGR02444 family protein [Arsukibacterium indicum]MBV2130849.1 TIGR02444 family protein [Arsukibacterium indicum]
MVSRPSAEALWQFSLALYPKVQSLCLQWQDNFGVNINLLLLLCYLEQQQLSLTHQQLLQLTAELEQFSSQFTKPLRALRRKSSSASLSTSQQQQLKQSLLQAELKLEQLEQQLLLKHCPSLTTNAKPLLELYFSQINAKSPALAAQIIDLRQACRQLN